MKMNDVEIGGRYQATVSGKRTIVRVLAVSEARVSTRSRQVTFRKRFVAVNEATGREITIRSAQRLRPLPTNLNRSPTAPPPETPR